MFVSYSSHSFPVSAQICPHTAPTEVESAMLQEYYQQRIAHSWPGTQVTFMAFMWKVLNSNSQVDSLSWVFSADAEIIV